MDKENGLKFPGSFRQDILEKILKIVARGESVHLFGPSGIGKTTLLGLLIDKLKLQKFNVISLDLGKIPQQFPPAPIVVILDHADQYLSGNYFSFFFQLKVLRDQMRPCCSIIFTANSDLSSKDNLSHFAPLETVLLENVMPVPPLSPQDAKDVLDSIANLYSTKISPADQKKILTTANGSSRLIKRLVKLTVDKIPWEDDAYLKFSSGQADQASQESIGPITFLQHLSKQEHLLAKLLINTSRQFVSREEMIEAVWKNEKYEVNEHALDQMLHRLRKKLESATPKCHLATYRGRGCKLET